MRLPAKAGLLAAGLAVIVIGVVVALAVRNQPVGSDQTVQHTGPRPAETAIDPAYQVPDGQPWRIAIESQNIEGFIQKVGIDQHQAIAAPDNVHLAGWFVQSVKPGAKGLSIIDGHLDGVSQQGIFHNLPKVAVGDKITVTEGGGVSHTYEVFNKQTIAAAKTANYLFDQDPQVSRQLNLITCVGEYDDARHEYSQRIIVSAKL